MRTRHIIVDITVISIDSGFVYPFAAFTDNEDRNAVEYKSLDGQVLARKIRFGEMVPAIFANDLFDKIETLTGWTLDGDLRGNSEFLKLAFTANKFLKSYDDKDNTSELTGANNVFYTASSRTAGAIFGNFARTAFNMPYDSSSSTMTISGDIILCDKTANYEFDFNLDLTMNIPQGASSRYAIRYCKVDSGGNFLEDVAYSSCRRIYFYENEYDGNRVFSNGTSTVELKKTVKATIYMEAGYYYKPFLYYYENTINSTGNYITTIRMNTGSNILFKETSTIYPLDEIDCEQVYDWPITSFLKDIILMFGVNLQPNNITKTLTFNLFNNLPTNEPEYWSEKVDLSKGISVSYKYGSYGQTNKMQYANSDESIDGYFSIVDLTLAPEKTVVKTASDGLPNDFDYQTFFLTEYTNVEIPLFDVSPRLENPDSETTIFYTDIYEKVDFSKCYFIRVGLTTPTADTHGVSFVGYANNLSTAGATLTFSNWTNTPLPFARFVLDNSAGLGFDQLIPTYYQTIIEMFTKTKVVTAYLNLTAAEIQSLNFNTPKKLINSRMNDDFYLLQVSNYKAGQSTKCTFIRL